MLNMFNKKSLSFRDYFLKNINPVIRFLIISDVAIVGAAGLLGPIFALFVDNYIVGANEAIVGIAMGIYLLTKSIMQIPVAYYIDKIRGEKDDFWLMYIFSAVIALLPLSYLFISTPTHLFIVQFLLGLFSAFTFPTFMAIFTRHIDRKKEGTEWGVYYTLVDLTSAAMAIVGGYVASSFGFRSLIILVVIISFIGTSLLLPIKPYLKNK